MTGSVSNPESRDSPMCNAHLRSGPSDHPGMTVSDLPCGLNLRSPNVGEERVDFRTQHVGFAAQLAGRAQHLAGSRSGLRRGGRDADDVAGNLGSAASGVLDVSGDLARWGALLFDGGGDRRGHLVDLADGLADVPDRAD